MQQQQLARKILQFNYPTYTRTPGEPAPKPPKPKISIEKKIEILEKKITKASEDIKALEQNIKKRKEDIEVLKPTITELEQRGDKEEGRTRSDLQKKIKT